MNSITSFIPFDGKFGNIRVVMQGNEPWFVAKDIAKALGYASPSDAVYRLVDKEDKRVAMLDNLQNPEMLENQQLLGISQSRTTIINESAVYSLVLDSQLDNAKQFKHWITSEVLPSIRRHGLYIKPVTLESILQDPDKLIEICKALKEEHKHTTTTINLLPEGSE